MKFRGIKAIVTDIEGTTSPISFVHDVLFPYARKHIPTYVRAHIDDIGDILAEIAQETGQHTMQIDECIETLLVWMDEDRKITPLKTLQGMIWEQGYKDGAFTGHVFADVAACLEKWQQSDVQLFVYSSGSVAAQKLIFGYSDMGDLTPYFTGYFDTTVGAKKEAASYQKITQSIGVAPDHILFLSDNPGELDAARDAGYNILGLNRPGNTFDLTGYASVNSFSDIKLEHEGERAA